MSHSFHVKYANVSRDTRIKKAGFCLFLAWAGFVYDKNMWDPILKA
jgi:hypothetical protein